MIEIDRRKGKATHNEDPVLKRHSSERQGLEELWYFAVLWVDGLLEA